MNAHPGIFAMAVLTLCTCGAPSAPPVSTAAAQPRLDGTEVAEAPYRSPYAKVPVWSPLYGTKCVFQEGLDEASCPTPYTLFWPQHGGFYATVCCPGSPEESVPPPEPQEPPWPPPACFDTGIPECDAYLKAQFHIWKHGETVEERLFWRGDLDLGCTSFRQHIRREGVDAVRKECVMAIPLLRSMSARSILGPPRPPAPVTRDSAIMTINNARIHQLAPPAVCPGALDECAAYLKALNKCWKRATPQVRSFLVPADRLDCRSWGAERMRESCQNLLDAVMEHPACKP